VPAGEVSWPALLPAWSIHRRPSHGADPTRTDTASARHVLLCEQLGALGYPNELKGAEAAAQKDTLKPMIRRWVTLGEEKGRRKRTARSAVFHSLLIRS
jgi:hypothetical protein